MEQVVVKPPNLPEQLHLMAEGPFAQDCTTISDRFPQAYETVQLIGEILKAIRTGGSLMVISIG